MAAVLLGVVVERGVAAAQRRGVLAALDDPLGVGRDEGSAVVHVGDRVLDDLLGLEVLQVDHGDARMGLVVDEDELAVVVAGRLRERRVVGVRPVDWLVGSRVAGGQDVLGADRADAPALPRLGREDADDLEQAHRRQADHEHLPAVAARAEHHVLVVRATGHVGLQRGRHVVGRQAARGGDLARRAGHADRRGGLLLLAFGHRLGLLRFARLTAGVHVRAAAAEGHGRQQQQNGDDEHQAFHAGSPLTFARRPRASRWVDAGRPDGAQAQATLAPVAGHRADDGGAHRPIRLWQRGSFVSRCVAGLLGRDTSSRAPVPPGILAPWIPPPSAS